MSTVTNVHQKAVYKHRPYLRKYIKHTPTVTVVPATLVQTYSPHSMASIAWLTVSGSAASA